MDLSSQAIQAAIRNDWKSAILLNLQILKNSSRDVDALNRLGRAYLETGQKTKSQLTYEKVLKLDKFNSIAAKSLELLKHTKVNRSSGNSIRSGPAPVFLEEPGITKTVSLTRLGDSRIISGLHPGDPVQIAGREHSVVIVSEDGEYLGRLSDDLASRMRLFLKAGNKYESWIRSVDAQSLKIFIKEISRAGKYRNNPSFPLTEKLTYAAFTPPELIHGNEKPDISTPEEDQSEYGGSEPDLENLEENGLTPMPQDD
jgi:hypothetical protein